MDKAGKEITVTIISQSEIPPRENSARRGLKSEARLIAEAMLEMVPGHAIEGRTKNHANIFSNIAAAIETAMPGREYSLVVRGDRNFVVRNK